jgi:hypothetical protein
MALARPVGLRVGVDRPHRFLGLFAAAAAAATDGASELRRVPGVAPLVVVVDDISELALTMGLG